MVGSNLVVYLKLVAVMLFWGTAFISGRTLAQSYHPFTIAFARFALASIILLTILYRKNKNFYKLELIQFYKVAFLGLTGVFLYNYFFFSGLKLVEAGRSSIVVATNPAFTTIVAYFILKEELNSRKLLGLFLAIAGAFIVISKGNIEFGNSGIGLGEMYLFLAVLSWVTYTIFGKVALKKLTSLEASTWASLLGAIYLAPFAFSQDAAQFFQQANIKEWFHVANLGIFSTCFGFIWYYDGVQKVGAAQASSFINLIPIFGISCGVIFLNETIDASLLIGGSIVILGVYLINKKKKLALNQNKHAH